MFYYVLPSLPDISHLSCEVRGQFLVGTAEALSGESMSEDALRHYCYMNRIDYAAISAWTIKYSLRGSLGTSDAASVEAVLTHYPTSHYAVNASIDESGNNLFSFEVWVESEADKDALFEQLKPLVDQYGELIDWHECSHDVMYAARPCVISETYVRG